jgi:hypothetical protein
MDYVVAAADGLCLSVLVRAYSSANAALGNVAELPELRWQLGREVVARARSHHSPVVLFLFDADTEHGRFLRLDTLPPPRSASGTITVALPVENTITARSLAALLMDLRRDARSK